MKGIDVSNANGKLDWEKIKKAGMDFAIIRSSYGSDIPGQTDRQFANNADGCKKYSIPFMTYHFGYFIDEDKAKEEADHAIRLAKEYPEIKAIALDVEEDTERYAREMGMSPDWTACCGAFLESIKAAGYIPVFYTNQNWMNNKLEYKKLEKYPLWLAAPDAPESVPMRYSNLVLWQNSWKGRIEGINGYFDTDICSNDELFSCGDNKDDDDGKAEHISSSSEVNEDVEITAQDGVNLRKGPGTGFKITGGIPCGETVHISRKTSGGGYIWGLTEYCGRKGWIALDYTKKVPQKSIDEIAHEVIRGLWGSGDERERLLTEAGYNYEKVQNRVNELLS